MSNIIMHPDWKLVEELECSENELCLRAATLIRALKTERRELQTEVSFLKYPDTSGQ